jgi:enamine deaminase RidA (YjgF/YER057c/UK114 family)
LNWLEPLDTNGELPSDITGQAEVAWRYILRMLEQTGMAVTGIAKVTTYLTRPGDIPAYAKIRIRFLGDRDLRLCFSSYLNSSDLNPCWKSKSSPPKAA